MEELQWELLFASDCSWINLFLSLVPTTPVPFRINWSSRMSKRVSRVSLNLKATIIACLSKKVTYIGVWLSTWITAQQKRSPKTSTNSNISSIISLNCPAWPLPAVCMTCAFHSRVKSGRPKPTKKCINYARMDPFSSSQLTTLTVF